MEKFIPILRVGRYKDASGKNCDITPQVLTDIVESYESKSAPLVKGHPNNEAPAMGWIDRLKIVGNELQASFCEVTEEFKSEVERHTFKNVSASFFMPSSDSNPSKGKYCLRHVGALGASRPAIPNLGTLQEALAFSEEDDLIEFFTTHKKSLREEWLKLFNKDKIEHSDLEQQLTQALQEIKELKTQLQQKNIDSQIQQLITNNKLSEDKASSFRAIVMKYSQQGTPPEEIIANFSEFIATSDEIHTHRFSEPAPIQDSVIDFAENIEHTAVFADEVDKLCQKGVARSDAYKQAKQNLQHS